MGASINEALADSAFLIVLCSPAAAASRWVAAEIAYFRELRGPDRILTVLVGERAEGPNPRRVAASYPTALGYSQGDLDDDVPGRVQPASADLRPGGDGRRLVRLKLVAGMLSVGLDELVRRDEQRRQRSIAAFAMGGVAALSAMGALTAAAIVSRDRAVAAQATATAQRAEAEALVEFMLRDLRKRVEPSGRLDLMEGVARRALAYFDAQRPADLDDRSLDSRARALRLLGEIEVSRGDLTDALSAFEQASATTAEVMARSPNDGPRVFDHAQSIYWVGFVAWQRGQLVEAEAAFLRYRRLAEQLVSINPKNDDWRAEVDYAYSDLGTLLLDQGRTNEALAAFRQSLMVSQLLVSKDPSDDGRQIDLGGCHAWLAQAFEQKGDLDAARAERSTELAIYASVLGRDPSNAAARFSEVVARRALARFDLLSDHHRRALAGFRDAAERAETLLAQQPSNMNTAGLAAISTSDLAEAYLELGRLNEAAQSEKRAETLIGEVRSHDQSVQLWRGYDHEIRLVKTRILARRGRFGEALAQDSETLSELVAPEVEFRNTETRLVVARAHLAVGDDLSALHRAGEAVVQWRMVLVDLPASNTVSEPRLLVVINAARQRLKDARVSRK